MIAHLTRWRTAPDDRPRQLSRARGASRRARSIPENYAHHYRADDFRDESSMVSTVQGEDSTSTHSEPVQEAVFEGGNARGTQDLEANRRNGKQEMPATASTGDPHLVTWEGPEDPENPKNWTVQSKWVATLIVSSFTFMSPVSSSMVAPALNNIGRDLDITSEVQKSLMISIFVLAFAVGPLLFGPLSEIYGRVIVLQVSNLFFLAFNIACGFAQSKSQLIVFRFISGLGGSAPLALGGGVLSDCWHAEERGKAMGIYTVAPMLGPAVGPIAGGFIAMNTTWRWCFWSTSIIDAGVQGLGLLFLRETYPPKILARKAKRLRQQTGNPNLYTQWDDPDRTLGKLLRTNLVRPFRLLGTQVIIQVMALYMAYMYGLMYLVLSTFPTVWQGIYHESIGIGGLNYISLGVGFFVGGQICGPMSDLIYDKLKLRNSNVGKPEFRVPLMLPGAILIPIGLFIYGWTSKESIHWIVPNIGACLFAVGAIMGFQCTQTYLVEAYSQFAASAIGAVVVMRSLAGFGFPLFAPYMYQALGQDWGNSLLGFVAIFLGIPAPVMLWKFGYILRKKSPYAAG